MNDLEYPKHILNWAWHLNETIGTSATLFSPVFNIDGSTSVRSGVTAPTGSTAAGRVNDLFRHASIGFTFIADLVTTGAASNPTFHQLGGLVENDTILNTNLKTTTMTIATRFLLKGVFGFPWIQFKIVNTDGAVAVPIHGAVRVFATSLDET